MAALDLSSLKNKEFSKRDINMALTALALVIAVASYLVGFQKLSEKRTTVENEYNNRSAYLSELQGYYDNLKAYQDGTAASRVSIKSNLDRLPVGFENEDFLLSMMHAMEKIGSKMSSINFNSMDNVSEFKTVIGDEYVDVQGFRASSTITATMTYDQFKTFLDNTYDKTQDVTFIDSVSVTYNAETAALNTVFNISKYFIKYEGFQYNGEESYAVTHGKTNPFGSK